MIAKSYKLWHGTLKLPGAGLLLRGLATISSQFRRVKLRISNGAVLCLDPRDKSCFYWLNESCGDQFEEHGLVIAFRKLVHPGAVVWDVGGNCGLFSYKASQSLKFREWKVFEPNLTVASIAESALSREGIIVLRTALSTVDGEMNFTIIPGDSLRSTLSPRKTERTGDEVRVAVRRGDSFAAEFGDPTVVKVDAEGHEVEVIEGMKQVLMHSRPVVFFEHLSLDDSEVAQLVPPRYSLLSVDRQTGELVQFAREAGHNSVLLPK